MQKKPKGCAVGLAVGAGQREELEPPVPVFKGGWVMGCLERWEGRQRVTSGEYSQGSVSSI